MPSVFQPPHDIVEVVDTDGNRKRVSMCMLWRLGDEVERGVVPPDIPEYNDPPGSLCHPEWRGGCGKVSGGDGS